MGHFEKPKAQRCRQAFCFTKYPALIFFLQCSVGIQWIPAGYHRKNILKIKIMSIFYSGQDP
jgi:hypothetical protein